MSDRIKNSRRNIYAGFASTITTILAGFITNTFIVHRFGIEYAGATSLIKSVLNVLNFSELGFSAAIILYMYAPLAKEETEKINSLLDFYRRVYHVIGTIILIAGIIAIPFFKFFIKGSIVNEINIYILYLIYLANTVLSYFMFPYYTSLLEAGQRHDMAMYSVIMSNITIVICQILTVLFVKNFYVFSISIFGGTIASNLMVFCLVKKIFPKYHCEGRIEADIKGKIYQQVKGLALINLGAVSRNSFDSIVISLYLGISIVGKYSNYYYIFNAMYKGISIVSNAIQASIGDSIALESVEKNYRDMMKIQLIFSWITSCVFCGLLLCYQTVIKIWVGEKNLLTFDNMIMFCIYFYVISLTSARNLYLNGKGLWWSTKYITLAEAIGNLLLNFILGKFWGINGILLASIVTLLVCNYFMINNQIFKYYFQNGKSKYYKLITECSALTIISAIICYAIIGHYNCNSYLYILISIALSLTVSSMFFWIFFHRTSIYGDAVQLIKSMIWRSNNA